MKRSCLPRCYSLRRLALVTTTLVATFITDALAVSSIGATSGDGIVEEQEPSIERTSPVEFFDLSSWNEDEKNSLFDTAVAIHDLDLRHRMIWPGLNAATEREGGDLSREGLMAFHVGRRRLQSLDALGTMSVEMDGQDAITQVPWERRANDKKLRRRKRFRNPKPDAKPLLENINKLDTDPQPSVEAQQKISLKQRKKIMFKKPYESAISDANARDGNSLRVRYPNQRCIDPNADLPCPGPDLKQTCDKYNKDATFKECHQRCKKAFCCAHDSLSKTFSPSCSKTEKNCPLYHPCYIVWWKLADTIGPAPYLRVEQDEPFYNGVDFTYINDDLRADEQFKNQLFGHHFDGDDPPTDKTFRDSTNW